MRKASRRAFIRSGASVSAAVAIAGRSTFGAGASANFKIGVTDWNLGQEGKVESIALARRLGFDGVQISIGRGTPDLPLLSLPLANRELQKRYLDESQRVGLPVESLCLDALHRNHLKSDPVGQRWVADAIPIAAAMKVRVILLPFFVKGALENQAEMDRVGDVLREVAPEAEKAGVVLGLEDTISARSNVRIMDRTRSHAVLTYYDVGNSSTYGFNPVEEIQWLGHDRICELHLKDNPHYLGEGKVDFPSVIAALAEIRFDRWAQLETDCPASVESDMRRNLKFIRGLVADRNSA